MTEMTAPVPTPQPVRALQLANRVRHARAELKARVANGQLAVADVILTCPFEVAGMPVGHLLATQRGWGKVRSRQFLARVAVREHKSIGSLTQRQRLAVAAQLAHMTATAQRRRGTAHELAANASANSAQGVSAPVR